MNSAGGVGSASGRACGGVGMVLVDNILNLSLDLVDGRHVD